jgi:hypothetical protein
MSHVAPNLGLGSMVRCNARAALACGLFGHCKAHHGDRQLHFRRRLDHRVETTGCFLGHPDALVSMPHFLPILQYLALGLEHPELV